MAVELSANKSPCFLTDTFSLHRPAQRDGKSSIVVLTGYMNERVPLVGCLQSVMLDWEIRCTVEPF